MRETGCTLLVGSLGLLLVLACSTAHAANACNEVNISWTVTSKSVRPVNAKQLENGGSSPSYINAIKGLSNANNDILAQFARKSEALGMSANDRGYLALKRSDPQFINALRRKQKSIDQRLLDLMIHDGLPAPKKVGIDGAMSAFLVMANTFDPAYAAKFAKLWHSGCARGALPCPAYAFIQDNALMLRDGIQRFGTGTGVPFRNGTTLEQVNKARADVGLVPLTEACMVSISRPGS